jgi:glycerol-3-phosphate dehydrogenase
MKAAPLTASLLAEELGRDESWEARQVAAFRELAAGYTLVRKTTAAQLTES